MLVSILSLNWSVSTTTQRVHVVIHNPIEAKKYFEWKSLINHVQNEVRGIKNNSNIITQLIQSDYVGYKVDAYILTQWALQGFQMEVHATQTINGWCIPWVPLEIKHKTSHILLQESNLKQGIYIGSLTKVWELQSIYKEAGIQLCIDLN